jgi:hypothetical protein
MAEDTGTLCTNPVTTLQSNLTVRVSSFRERRISAVEGLIPIRPCSNEAGLVLPPAIVEVV